MSKLLLDPAQGSYTARLGPETIAVALAGGKSRYRRDQLGAAALAQVEWFLEPNQYDYLMAFYRSQTAHGSLSFTLDAILDSAPVQEYTAHFVPGTLELAGVQGRVYIVVAQLELIPRVENALADLALVLYRQAELAPPGPLDLIALNPALVVQGNSLSVNNTGVWRTFYSWYAVTNAPVVASWRTATATAMGAAGLLSYIPPADGDPNGHLAGSNILYTNNDNDGIYYQPPGGDFVQISSGLSAGAQYTVIIKGGVAYYFRSIGDTVEFLASNAATANAYRFGGQMLSGKFTDVKLAPF